MAYYEKDLTTTEQLEHVESYASTDSDELNDARIHAFTPEEQKKIIRRVDRRLVLTLGALYCVSLMDRTNTGIAVIAGMGVDLVLIKERYSIIVLVFFLTYVLLQPPATVVLRKIGPRLFLPTITLLWGMTMICSKSQAHTSTLLSWQSLTCLSGFRKDLDTSHPSPSRSRYIRSRLLPRLCIPPELLVPSIRIAEAKCSVLPHRVNVISILWNPRVRLLATRRPRFWRRAWSTLRSDQGTPSPSCR